MIYVSDVFVAGLAYQDRALLADLVDDRIVAFAGLINGGVVECAFLVELDIIIPTGLDYVSDVQEACLSDCGVVVSVALSNGDLAFRAGLGNGRVVPCAVLGHLGKIVLT